MTTTISKIENLETMAGVQPSTDMTPNATPHYVFTDKIRFESGYPKKIGGWASIQFNLNATIDGYARSLYTDFIDGRYYSVIGTHTKLYSLLGTSLTNITPLVTTGEAIADSLDSHYGTLVNNPITSTDGSNTLIIADSTAERFRAGDEVVLSGSSAVGGIPDTDINKDHIVRSVGSGFFTIRTATPATSSVVGGGASVVRASGIVRANATAHGLPDGDRVRIDDATSFAGLDALEINKEFIIRNVTVNSFDFVVDDTATSSVSGGGGASTEYFEEIPIGLRDEQASVGYGAGLYGVGLYGISKTSSSSRSYPRIWFVDRYGNTLIMTAGNQGGLYQWLGDSDEAPALIANAPTAVNYAFISDNILVTFGAGNIENRVFASDQNDIENWTSSSINQVYDDDIEGAGRLISHVPVEDYNLIFTEHKTYTMRYIGLPFVWEIKPKDETVGIISPMARISVKGIALWMGQDNLYMYRGGTVETIRANSQSECTALRYVFDNLNYGQKSKIFAWYNKEYSEAWFHYPSANSNECDRIIRVNIDTFEWTIDTMDRTCAEYPNTKLINPRLINIGTLYKHEFGNDADGQPMPFTIKTNRKKLTKDSINTVAFIPDSLQTGNLTVTLTGYQYPQSATPMYTIPYTITPTTERVSAQFNARFWDYTIQGTELGQSWRMGQWFEEIQKGPMQ